MTGLTTLAGHVHLTFETLTEGDYPVPVLYMPDGTRVVLPIESYSLEADAEEPGFAHFQPRLLVRMRERILVRSSE